MGSEIPYHVKDELLRGAVGGYLPSNVRCPAGCRFCYERSLSRLFPAIETRTLPRYSDASLAYFRSVWELVHPGEEADLPADADQPAFVRAGDISRYFPRCDSFSLGLSGDQIEGLVRDGIVTAWSTTGLGLDVPLLERLSRRYPDRFRVHLSIITFDVRLRARLMNPAIDLAAVRAASDVLVEPVLFLMYLDPDQVASDVEELAPKARRSGGSIYLHKLYYNRLDSPEVAELADRAEESFPAVVGWLQENDDRLGRLSERLALSPHSRVYAHRWREELARLLDPCRGGSEAVLCSTGARTVLEELLGDRGVHVVPVESALGGSVDFTVGMTVSGVRRALERLDRRGVALERVYLPSTMFPVEGRHDLDGRAVEALTDSHPELDVVVVEVPAGMSESTVSLDDCVSFLRQGC